MVEQLICNQQVKGSSPFVSSLPKNEESEEPTNPARGDTRGLLSAEVSRTGRREGRGGVPEWPKGADCKSAALSATKVRILPPPLEWRAGVAQLVEHQPSKLRVTGSSPVARSLSCGAEGSGSRSSVGRARPWEGRGHRYQPG